MLIVGHVIDGISELPLVVSDKIQEYTKTKQAVLFLRRNKLWGDVLKVNIVQIFNFLSHSPGVLSAQINLKRSLRMRQ